MLNRSIRALVTCILLMAVVAPPSAAYAAADSPTDVVMAAYRDLLDRTPEPSGLEYWVGLIDEGVSPSAVVAAIGDADEQRRLVVTQAYRRVLKRGPDTEGLSFWSRDIIDRSSEADLYALIFGSQEYFLANGNNNRSFATALYRDILTRTPDAEGLDFWISLLEGGYRRDLIAREFLSSAEAILQPTLSVISANPHIGSTASHLGRITIDLDQDIDAERSAVLVSAGGLRIQGTTTAGSSANQLVFTPASLPAGLRRGALVNVVVTVFAYRDGEFGRTDYTYTLNPSAVSALNELIVAFYGHAKTGDLGVLGEGTPHEALTRLLAQAAPYRTDPRPIVPAFELIATLVTAAPGADGKYRARTDHALIQPYLDEIRAAGGYLILDLQPGRADLEDEARFYEPLLLEPEVGLALDPEWKVGPTETPAGRIGSIGADEINRVSAFMSNIVVANDLPNKILIIHRFEASMVQNPDLILTRPGVTIIFQADGEGSPAAKVGDYDTLLPARFGRGFKVFYDEDNPTLTPSQVLDLLDPAPDYLSYQ